MLLEAGVRRTELVNLDRADLNPDVQRLRGSAQQGEQAAGGAVWSEGQGGWWYVARHPADGGGTRERGHRPEGWSRGLFAGTR